MGTYDENRYCYDIIVTRDGDIQQAGGEIVSEEELLDSVEREMDEIQNKIKESLYYGDLELLRFKLEHLEDIQNIIRDFGKMDDYEEYD